MQRSPFVSPWFHNMQRERSSLKTERNQVDRGTNSPANHCSATTPMGALYAARRAQRASDLCAHATTIATPQGTGNRPERLVAAVHLPGWVTFGQHSSIT